MVVDSWGEIGPGDVAGAAVDDEPGSGGGLLGGRHGG